MTGLDTICPNRWVAEAVKRGRVVARVFVYATDRERAKSIGRAGHIAVGTSRRHGRVSIFPRPATALDLGAVPIKKVGP